MSLYTMLILLSCLALCVLCILVRENGWIPREDKRRFYLAYGIIAFSALAEWTGLQLNGNSSFPAWMLPAVKCVDYILTPMAGGAIVAQMKLRNRWSKGLMYVLAVNAIFQIPAMINHWVLVIDAEHRYAHGPFYWIYVGVCLLVVFLTAAQFLVYGKAYRRQNRASLYAVFLLVLVGIVVQEVMGGEYRTAYIALTMGVALMFIHYSEFYQMAADEHIRQQHDQLMRDALTGAFSRHAYRKSLETYRDMAWLPENMVAFSIDLNGLKMVNDTIGHEAGDELIIGAARCIEKAFGDESACFRTGGDEFVVLARMDRDQADFALQRLDYEVGLWKGEKGGKLSLSAGYALAQDHAGYTVEKLVIEADRAMYASKAEYYRKHGRGRRGTRRDR